VSASLVVVGVLFDVELMVVAGGWQVWMFWVVSVRLFDVELGVVVVG
jgi:hypothetical protein